MKEVSIRQQNGEIIKVRVPETRKDLLSLDKVEIRYNVRKGQPDYKAMKSLYKLRSVFGYRLGGAIRKAYVKLAELGRHKENFVTLRKAINQGNEIDLIRTVRSAGYALDSDPDRLG